MIKQIHIVLVCNTKPISNKGGSFFFSGGGWGGSVEIGGFEKPHMEPGRTPHMKGVGLLVGNFELNPSRRPIWAWPKLFLTPKRDHVKTQTI